MSLSEKIIAPSLLAADHGAFAKGAIKAERAGADWLHIDIMDGHFVPNISFGPEVVKSLRPVTNLFFDVHLMCSKPEILLEPFAEAGADLITIHGELDGQTESLIWKIKALGLKVGLALNPPTGFSVAEPFLPQVDLLLVMTVNPGFGGQSFISETLPKIRQAREYRHSADLSYRIEVDGGIKFETVVECANAGADTFVSGTGLFGQKSMKTAVAKMRKMVDPQFRVDRGKSTALRS